MQDPGDRPIDAADQSEHAEPAVTEPERGENQVPVHVLQKYREEMRQLKEHNKMLADQHDLMKSYLSNQQTPQREPEINEDEPLTMAQAKQVLDQRDRTYRLEMQELKAAHQFPDYKKTVDTYLGAALKEDPDLRDEINMMIQSGKDAARYVYKRCKASQSYQEAEKKTRHSKAAENVSKHADHPPSLAQMGKGVQSSGADYIRNMSQDDFKKLVARNSGEW